MTYKIYTRLDEEDRWDAVIDMKLSISKRIDREFTTKEEAEFFVKKHLTTDDPSNIMIEEVGVE